MASGVLDLEQVVRDWAWRQFDDTATKKEKKLRQKEKKAGATSRGSHIGITTDWSEVRFRDETKWSRICDADLLPEAGLDTGDAAATEGATSPSGKLIHVQSNNQTGSGPVPRETGATGAVDHSAPQASILFQTKFTNNTKDQQEYSMKTEKTTRSSCSTEIETGYTRGIEMSVTLKSPCEIFEANAGYKQEFSLTNVDGETFEEELTWGVESLIKVKAEHEAHASLIVDERKQQGNFTIQSHISGMVYVTFTNIRDNNSLLKATGHPISQIVSEFLEKQRRKGQPMDFVKIEGDKVFVTTKGKCNFRYGIKQEVKVNQTKI